MDAPTAVTLTRRELSDTPDGRLTSAPRAISCGLFVMVQSKTAASRERLWRRGEQPDSLGSNQRLD